jgi:hypothetical protein
VLPNSTHSVTAQSHPKPASVASSSKGGREKSSELVLTQTKPDIAVPPDPARDHTIDSPMQALGDGWKMVAYLLPTLVFVLVCLNLLRRYQQRTGQLPAVVQRASRGATPAKPNMVGTLAALFSGGQGARRGGPSSGGIRLLESLTVGTSTLHLVQVRGRTLLLAGGPTGVTVLTEFVDQDGVEPDDFREMLKAAAADLDGLDLPDRNMPVSAVVDSLEEVMRDTGDSVERRLRRLRTVRETEDGGL